MDSSTTVRNVKVYATLVLSLERHLRMRAANGLIYFQQVPLVSFRELKRSTFLPIGLTSRAGKPALRTPYKLLASAADVVTPGYELHAFTMLESRSTKHLPCKDRCEAQLLEHVAVIQYVGSAMCVCRPMSMYVFPIAAAFAG